MEKRHENLLTARLERVVNASVAHVLWEELYSWYGVKKIAAGTWRDLSQRWDELTSGDKGSLMKIEGSGGLFLTAEKEITPIYKQE